LRGSLLTRRPLLLIARGRGLTGRASRRAVVAAAAAIGLPHFVVRVQPAQLLRERHAQRECFDTLAELTRGHLPPHGDGLVVVRLHVLVPVRHGEHRRLEPRAQHGDARRAGRELRQPHLAPHAVVPAPLLRELADVLAGALCDQTEAVDRCLERPAILVAVAGAGHAHAPLDGVDLLGERIELPSLADHDEDVNLRRRCAGHDRLAQELHALLIEVDDGRGVRRVLLAIAVRVLRRGRRRHERRRALRDRGVECSGRRGRVDDGHGLPLGLLAHPALSESRGGKGWRR
jgi:hypothetical protein